MLTRVYRWPLSPGEVFLDQSCHWYMCCPHCGLLSHGRFLDVELECPGCDKLSKFSSKNYYTQFIEDFSVEGNVIKIGMRTAWGFRFDEEWVRADYYCPKCGSSVVYEGCDEKLCLRCGSFFTCETYEGRGGEDEARLELMMRMYNREVSK